MLPRKKINLFIGHYGVGKTTIAVNLAHRWRMELEEPVALADIDVNNPYFRSRDWASSFKKHGIELIIPDEEIAQAEMPFLPKHIYAALHREGTLLLDVGGYSTGTTVLGSLSETIKNLDYQAWFVVNTFRPGSQTDPEIEAMFQRLQAISRLNITGIINNSNLGEMTAPEHVINSEAIVRAAAENLSVPYFINGADPAFMEALDEKITSPIIPIQRLEHLKW